jgi:hypothetical protein
MLQESALGILKKKKSLDSRVRVGGASYEVNLILSFALGFESIGPLTSE